MPSTVNFYIDDSGTRHPDHKPGRKPKHGYDYFSLGGVLIKSEDEKEARHLHSEFCKNWEFTDPIHSTEIRSMSGKFHWLKKLSSKDRDRFFEELYQLMANIPAIGLACVIDRPGYNNRYLKKYGRERWALCKTSFSIVVDRAAKYALSVDRKLRVYPERCNKKEDRQLRYYYESLKQDGHPFSISESKKYNPLKEFELYSVLYEFKLKKKSSPMTQMADLYLWPMCIGGYHAGNRPYARLISDNKIIDCTISKDQISERGIKYSCFDLIKRKS